MCRSAPGTKGYNANCNGDSECQSGFCYDTGFFGGLCSKHCCSSEDCDSVSRCTAFSVGSQIATACIPLGFSESSGSKRGGDTCAGNGDCRSARCGDGICTEFCCRDSDCIAGSACKPRKAIERLVRERVLEAGDLRLGRRALRGDGCRAVTVRDLRSRHPSLRGVGLSAQSRAETPATSLFVPIAARI